MCGRYNITKTLSEISEDLERELIIDGLFGGLVNVAPGDKAITLTHAHDNKLQYMQFGLTPSWAQKRMYVFNARSEGDKNPENLRDYQGAMGILQKPMFRAPIRRQRCLIVANSFLEGPQKEKLSKPYLIFRNDFSCFTFGGIWDQWVDPSTGEVLESMAIITTPATSITAAVGHHRAPLIISPAARNTWLDPDTELDLVIQCMQPFDGDEYNACPISPDIKNPRNKNIESMYPTGKSIHPVTETKVVEGLELLGMGESPARSRDRDT